MIRAGLLLLVLCAGCADARRSPARHTSRKRPHASSPATPSRHPAHEHGHGAHPHARGDHHHHHPHPHPHLAGQHGHHHPY